MSQSFSLDIVGGKAITPKQVIIIIIIIIIILIQIFVTHSHTLIMNRRHGQSPGGQMECVLYVNELGYEVRL